MMELAHIDGAANLWMAHNHPSGTPDLSNADRNLSGAFEKILEGSNVQYRGLAAVARQGANVGWTTSDFSNGSVIAEHPAKFKVPMVEREITESNPVATVSSPTTAKSLVANIAKDQPGVLFLTAQNGVSAFVPFDPKEMGELRTGDRLLRLFRAASKAGGVGALVAMPDGKVTGQQFANLKGALGTVDIKVLDGIEYDTRGTGKVESLAEKGLDLSVGANFYSQSTTPGQLDEHIFTQAWTSRAGSGAILDTIARGSATPFNRELAKLLKAKGFTTKVKARPIQWQRSRRRIQLGGKRDYPQRDTRRRGDVLARNGACRNTESHRQQECGHRPAEPVAAPSSQGARPGYSLWFEDSRRVRRRGFQ
jgi:hypothetical protein